MKREIIDDVSKQRGSNMKRSANWFGNNHHLKKSSKKWI